MGKVFLVIMVSVLLSFKTNAQTLEEIKEDNFTSSEVKRTYWEKIGLIGVNASFFRVSQINESLFFDLNIIHGIAFSINENDLLIIKLNNGNILELKAFKSSFSCRGCGEVGTYFQGLKVSYPITLDEIALLKESSINTIRVYTSSDFLEFDFNSKKQAKRNEMIINAFNLVLNP